MLTHFEIDNFKSLVGFSLPLSRFNCLIGLNGAGKTTVLQALDFASHVMSGEVREWLEARGWSAADLTSRLGNKSNIELALELDIDGLLLRWEATFNRVRLACTREEVKVRSSVLEGARQYEIIVRVDGAIYELKSGKYWHRSESADPSQWNEIPFIYEGSLLSQLKDNQLSPLLRELRERIKAIRSLDLLSPEQLRRKTRLSDLTDDIGSGGQQLGAFIHQLKAVQRDQLLQRLQRYYPQVTKIHTSVLRGGAIKLELHESYQATAQDGQESLLAQDMVTEARHINDGMLRLLAILAQQFSPYQFVLFDEVENGVNPEITEALVDALVSSSKQLLVTTHSPLVLNYLEDDIARQSVLLIYKRPDGISRAIRLFDVPMAAERLECLSPGESMLDLSLTRVAEAAEQMVDPSRGEG
ncbi:AAA family ATPase [Aeromonas veronii]|uniref:AAA family ATPase n=1 Tax=Aeromonas TaxID=642 RepID=UPI0013219384|nr:MULTISPECIES: ATP-binding protein [Aeromonas]MCO5344370.1 AAA family ATPase [Aeromonas veronii]MCR3965157.1 AAA family ATPase [Aeromonas veronii]MXQ69984.1 AAA family ATPase [Aeromonas caviae]QJT27435.1 ATP-binding protein [Aeromonas media]